MINTYPGLAFTRYSLVSIVLAAGAGIGTVSAQSPSHSPLQKIVWKGHTWNVTNGGMAGVSPGSGRNVFVDPHGYLHLKITRHGSVWTAAELFTTDKLRFGTYQWQIEGKIDAMAPSTVLDLFPYGPAAHLGSDGENELDTEFSQWNKTVPTNADFTYYPATGCGRKDAHGDAVAADNDNFSFTLAGGTLTTARTVWSATQVTGTVLRGLQPLNSVREVLHTHTFAPADPKQQIPQTALPLGINFWSFQAVPDQDQEVVIRDFQYAPPSPASHRRSR